MNTNAAEFRFPPAVHGIISTFALALVPEYESVIRSGSQTLSAGGRFVILDFKLPSNWLRRLAPLLVLALRPFGVTLDLAVRRPWEAMRKCFDNVSMTELYGGIAYMASSEKRMETRSDVGAPLRPSIFR